MENKMKRTLLVLSILVLAVGAFAQPWTIGGTFIPNQPTFDLSRVTMTAPGTPSAGVVTINATSGAFEVDVPDGWTGTLIPIIEQIPGYTCAVNPTNVGYTNVKANQLNVLWAITCTQDFVYKLNVTSIPTGKSVLRDVDSSTITTDGLISDADVANVIGTYTMQSAADYGYDWNNLSLVVSETDFNEDNEWTHTILFDQVYTLPVELSSFTAVLTSDMYVKIAWISESETNHAGYNILRSEVRELSTAMLINNGMIDQGIANGTQMNYLFTDTEVANQSTYYYWLESIGLDGSSEYFGPLNVIISTGGGQSEMPIIPVETTLLSAFPNPFNPSTNLRYSMKEAGTARLDIYNSKGQLMKTYSASHGQAGYYQMNWDGRDINGQLASTGVYFYRMTSGNYSSTKKMVLAK